MMGTFDGLVAFPLTPATWDGQVETQGLTRLLSRLCDAGVDSIGLLGSTGIYAYLSREQREFTVRTAVRHVGGRLPIIVGVGALRTDAAEDLARDAQRAGADGLLLAPVSYTPLTEEEVFEHFAAVARAVDLPICIYNNPSTTHFSFTADLLERLADLPNIVALKNPAPAASALGQELAALKARLPPGFAIGYSGDWNAAEALLAGASAWYSVVSGLLPGPALALTRAAQVGNAAEVHRIDAMFTPLWALFKELSSLRVMYAAANILGLSEAKPPRPILPLGSQDTVRIAQALADIQQTPGPHCTAS